jgi:predicted dehydrogenase
VEVEDTAVATLRFASAGLAPVKVSLCQNPGIHTWIHVHGSNGASVGVQTNGGATFIAGITAVTEAPYNDLWTIPGEVHRLPEWQEEDRSRFGAIDPVNEYHERQIRDFLSAIQEDHSLVTGEDGRKVVEIFNAIYRSHGERRAVSLPLSS